ncbi:hypothetical protein BHE90_013663 [Fusarium euwallaceae]|uniref:Fumarate lyase N-terminal domain-containing protein n=1 Tax=Fusarium euwallaceae TaxID=1147111 RepID=A0A430L856_9HYPO|nr:hypothetical protein BHE90_013663 [Fusarium euwallaceae]
MASDSKPEGSMLWVADSLYNESIFFDRILYKQDILGSIAFTRANAKSGIVTQEEFEKTREGLEEDIHTANERRLGEIIGKNIAGKLHTGRTSPARSLELLDAALLAFAADLDRLRETIKRVNRSPLGCGALAGNPFNIDRDMMAEELCFEGLLWNSMGGVADRDFATTLPSLALSVFLTLTLLVAL